MRAELKVRTISGSGHRLRRTSRNPRPLPEWAQVVIVLLELFNGFQGKPWSTQNIVSRDRVGRITEETQTVNGTVILDETLPAWRADSTQNGYTANCQIFHQFPIMPLSHLHAHLVSYSVAHPGKFLPELRVLACKCNL